MQRLAFTDINPCFQALVLAHRLLPNIETFSVGTTAADAPLIMVSADALEAAMPVWEYAISVLDQIPLSTFLTANLDARQRLEDLSVSVRSVAWIAVDDAVGVIDGSPNHWDYNTKRMLDARLQIVEMAVEETASRVGQPSPRLQSVLDSVRELRLWMRVDQTADAAKADEQPALVRLRLQWDRWGPVRRHPSISNDDAPELSERQPRLRTPPGSFDYLTL